jgi:[acyl-carrier-protein] S-malonyltransferase
MTPPPTPIFMFPGQSSRYPEMLAKLVALRPENGEVIEAAAKVLGRDLRAHYEPGNPHIFERNVDVQLGMFLANHLHLLTVQARGLTAGLSLGLSLGEYNHLVHIGALTFDEALTLVEARGRAYDEGPAGAMACVHPIGAADMQAVLDHIEAGNRLVIGSFNSPQQQVLSGERATLDEALAVLETTHFVESVIIEPNIPMHAPAFAKVAQTFRPALRRARWRRPHLPYVSNVVGRIVENPGPDDFVRLLSAHVSEPVRWQDSVEHLAARTSAPAFVEVGPRAVLFNLFTKKWRPGPRFKTDHADGMEGRLNELATELGRAA